MIHDIAIWLTFSNQARSPAKTVLIRIDGETIRVGPGQEYGPVSFFLEENELILFQPENEITPLFLQWTENNRLVQTGSSDWKNSSKKSDGHFELLFDNALLIIRYQLKVKNRKTIVLTFSAHSQMQGH